MALCTDAAMVLFYDIAGDTADHDDWHTYEHLHERLSIPGFVRATRWVATAAAPRYLVIYEVDNVEVATSADYLARLNDPSAWTSSMMGRFRGMIRGFAGVVASSGFGLGAHAVAMRFTPRAGREQAMREHLAREALPAAASRRGMASIQLFEPAPLPPMTREQSIRGADLRLPWLLFATGYDRTDLSATVDSQVGPAALEALGAESGVELGSYFLHYTVTDREVARTSPHPPLRPDLRRASGVGRT